MILIWDNGGSYSDHAVYFIDCGAWEPAVVELVLVACNPSRMDEGKVIAVIADAAWRDPKAVDTLADRVDPWRLMDETFWHDDAARLAALRSIPKQVLAYLVGAWRKTYPTSDLIKLLAERDEVTP